MSSIGELIKYVMGRERYSMQTGVAWGQKSNYTNETHREVLIYGRAQSRTSEQSLSRTGANWRGLELGHRLDIDIKIYRSLYTPGRKTCPNNSKKLTLVN